MSLASSYLWTCGGSWGRGYGGQLPRQLAPPMDQCVLQRLHTDTNCIMALESKSRQCFGLGLGTKSNSKLVRHRYDLQYDYAGCS